MPHSNSFDRRHFIGAAGAAGSAALFGMNAALAKSDDPDGLNLDPSPGPAAWLDEYWDVKPDKFKEFIEVYQNEICEIARRIPGYRGYSIYTSFEPTPEINTRMKNLGGSDNYLVPHFGIQIDGEVATETAINYSALMKKTYNVVVTHHVQTWSAANQFRSSLNKAYADKSNGYDLSLRLMEVLYPLANNFWRATYRTLFTGYAGNVKGPKKGKDADGLNLAPYTGALNLNIEYARIKPGREQAYFDTLRDGLFNAIRVNPGYRGMSAVTSIPPLPSEGHIDLEGAQLGSPDSQFVWERGMLLGGKERTDRYINFGQAFQNWFNVFYVHYFAPDNPGMASQARFDIFAKKHEGKNLRDFYANTLFYEETNHFENNYRMVAQSFSPHGGKGG